MNFKLEDGAIKTPDLEFDENCGGIGNVYFKAFQKYRERVALINSKTDEFYTYSELLEKSKATALALQQRGFKKGDLVALCSNRENLNANLPIIAGQFLGCITFSLDPLLSSEECSELLEQVSPKIIFVIEEAKERIETAVKICNIQTDVITFGKEFEENFLKIDEDEDTFKPLFIKRLQHSCLIHFSSGSTGTPKAICLNHYYLLILLQIAGVRVPESTQKKTFSNYPIGSVSLRYANWYWCSASFEIMIYSSLGGCRILQDTLNPQDIWRLIDKYQITHLILTPLQCIEVSRCIKPHSCDISSLTSILTGGYVLHKDYICFLRECFPGVYVCQHYGMTECGLATSFDFSNPQHRRLLNEKPNSCGVPVNGLCYKVVDVETGKKCGPNQPGELYLKGKHLFNGFYNRDSSKSFDNEGYFRTGDLVYFDEDFCFFILDRIKAVLGWNDWLIYPHHIEKVLLNHPSVDIAIVIGIPHKTEGERLMGLVVLRDDAPKVTEDELVEYVAARVEDHKRLREGIRFVKYLPTTITGKINRLKAKEMILRRLEEYSYLFHKAKN